MSTYAILIPLGYTLAPRYNITNAAILGCFYLASGQSFPSPFVTDRIGRNGKYFRLTNYGQIMRSGSSDKVKTKRILCP